MIAGAWSLVGTDTIFGRQWGCLAQIDFLHFEVCYYQTIERAIAAGYARVEAGVQGEHKIARGFEPVLTQSWHWVKHKGFETAIHEFLQHERGLVDQQIEIYNTTTPYKKASV
jgi:predicted N-acyltransferase